MKHHHTVDKEKHNPRYALLATGCAVASVTILILIKIYAYYYSGSAAILGSLTDSITDVTISVMMLFAVRYSLKPADSDHRHGHGKIEGIATLMQSAFMGGAGIFLCFESAERFITPQTITHHNLAITVSIISIALTFAVLAVQRFSLRRAPSLIVAADHEHYKTDVFLNLGVITAIVLDLYTNIYWIDPIIALLIAGYFIWTAFDIARNSVDMLMDREVSPQIRQHIEEIVSENTNVHGLHDLRTRKSGMRLDISFDVELSPDLSLKAAHDIVRDIDHEILKHYPHAEIIIHMDPIGDTDDPRHTVRGIHH